MQKNQSQDPEEQQDYYRKDYTKKQPYKQNRDSYKYKNEEEEKQGNNNGRRPYKKHSYKETKDNKDHEDSKNPKPPDNLKKAKPTKDEQNIPKVFRRYSNTNKTAATVGSVKTNNRFAGIDD